MEEGFVCDEVIVIEGFELFDLRVVVDIFVEVVGNGFLLCVDEWCVFW